MPKAMKPADLTAAFARGVPLAPAAWVDVTFGAGSVASTADDMIRFMRSLADAAQGRGGLGLVAAAGASAFTSHAVRERYAGHELRQWPDACRQCAAAPTSTTPAGW